MKIFNFFKTKVRKTKSNSISHKDGEVEYCIKKLPDTTDTIEKPFMATNDTIDSLFTVNSFFE